MMLTGQKKVKVIHYFILMLTVIDWSKKTHTHTIKECESLDKAHRCGL